MYGKVELDEQELDALKLPPKTAVYSKIKMKDIRLQEDICSNKQRWGRIGMLRDMKGTLIVEEEEVKTDEQILEENKYRETYDPDTKTIDFRKVRATDVKNNPRVCLPPARPVREEAEFMSRNVMVDKVTERFMNNNPRGDNLTESEKAGVEKLVKRSKAGEIVIYQTDKSGKSCVASVESYKRQGVLHTRGDEVVTWEQIQEAQRMVKGHLRGMNLIFQAGLDQGESGQGRVWRSKELESTTIPLLSVLAKDHKPVAPGEDPKTRPVC